MSDRRGGGVRHGLLGPWRRWRSWAPRERVVLAAVWLVSGAGAGIGWFLLSRLLGDDEGVGSAVFFAVAMVVVTVYTPELNRLWHKTDGDS